ncbi:MAG TPA: hypothetical protein PKL74_11105, partial [Tenuifilaceae bacterium]|nr:hypothetical protein [Tenuifilaceae bacterium]
GTCPPVGGQVLESRSLFPVFGRGGTGGYAVFGQAPHSHDPINLFNNQHNSTVQPMALLLKGCCWRSFGMRKGRGFAPLPFTTFKYPFIKTPGTYATITLTF